MDKQGEKRKSRKTEDVYREMRTLTVTSAWLRSVHFPSTAPLCGHAAADIKSPIFPRAVAISARRLCTAREKSRETKTHADSSPTRNYRSLRIIVPISAEEDAVQAMSRELRPIAIVGSMPSFRKSRSHWLMLIGKCAGRIRHVFDAAHLASS